MTHGSSIVKTLKKSRSEKQLVLFPYLGGYWNAYSQLVDMIEEDWEVLAINPPGHGMDRGPLIDNITDMVTRYASELSERMKNHSVFFGHSLGGMVVFQLATYLDRKIHAGKPSSIIISGAHPPQIIKEKISLFPDEQLLNYLKKIEGLPEEILECRELLDYFLPSFKADFRVIESIRPDIMTSLNYPAYILSGVQDHFITEELLMKWRGHLPRSQFHQLEGGHMNIRSHPSLFLSIVKHAMDFNINA